MHPDLAKSFPQAAFPDELCAYWLGDSSMTGSSPEEGPPAPMEVDTLERQVSWALPELPRATSALYTWGRSDMGQTGLGKEESVFTPQPAPALEGKDIVHVAGSMYNSAFVTRESSPSILFQTLRVRAMMQACTLLQDNSIKNSEPASM